jgi:hypothetical protein
MSFYLFHEFWSEVLVFHTMNVLAMLSTPFQNLFLSLAGHNMVTISNPYFTAYDRFLTFIMSSYLLKRSYTRNGYMLPDQTDTIILGVLEEQE